MSDSLLIPFITNSSGVFGINILNFLNEDSEVKYLLDFSLSSLKSLSYLTTILFVILSLDIILSSTEIIFSSDKVIPLVPITGCLWSFKPSFPSRFK